MKRREPIGFTIFFLKTPCIDSWILAVSYVRPQDNIMDLVILQFAKFSPLEAWYKLNMLDPNALSLDPTP